MSKIHDPDASRPGDWIYRILAWLEPITPRSLYVWLAQHVTGPERSARIVSFLPEKSLVSVVNSMPAEFNAKVAPYLTKQARARLVQALPLPTLVEVTRALFAQGSYIEAAKFGLLMTPSHVKALVVAQNDPDGMAHTAQHYNASEIVRIAHAFSGPYLVRLAAALGRNGYHKVEAELGNALPIAEIAAVVKGLEPAQAVRYLVCCDETRLNEVLARLPDDKRNAIMQALLDEKVKSRNSAGR